MFRAAPRYLGFLLAVVSSGSALGAEAGNDALMILLDQNRALQAEVQALRALIEEQGFELRRLQRESLDRYTDTDTRLSAIEQGMSQGAVSAPVTAPAPAGIASTAANSALPSNSTATAAVPTLPPTEVNPIGAVAAPPTAGTRPSLQPAVLTEQELYQMAYESAISSEFERAIAEFDQYLSLYPDGRFTTNVHYWKGQSYLYLSRYEEAIASYQLILDRYPDAAKVPDAMYGLGVAYEGMGDLARARQYMQDIKRRFPNTGVANLADTRLLSLQ